MHFKTLLSILLLSLLHAPAVVALTSYATSATDEIGSTGSAAVALGVPDDRFVNDAGIGLAGNTDTFDVGESVVLAFPAPLRAIASHHDLVVSAWVGGLGETDNASVQVEVSTDGLVFSVVTSFDTQDARNRAQDDDENDFAGVKHFWIDFAGADLVTHVRLTNLAGTAEGLRLDAVEGLHPVVDATHAVEIRLARYAPDSEERFRLRLKNMADPGGVPIRGFRIDRPSDPAFGLTDTAQLLASSSGAFVCVEGCIGSAGPAVPFGRHVWSISGGVEAPPGLGLDPGHEISHLLGQSFKAETPLATYLSGFRFTITFADGLVQVLDYDEDVLIAEGQLYQKYPYLTETPTESGPRPSDYSEWRRRSIITFSNPPSVGAGHTPSLNGRLIPTSQNFTEEGMHVEGFWAPNDEPNFIEGHFHNLDNGFERSHGFESTPGMGPDRQGIYIERVDGGLFDLERLDYRLGGGLLATSILISPTYDPSLPITGQFTEFPVVENPDFETLSFSQFTDVSSLFILAIIVDPLTHRVDWDDIVIRTDDVMTIPPVAVAGPDLETTDTDDDGTELVSVDGSGSSDLDGTVDDWSWREDGLELESGELTSIPFAVGRHQVTLRVLDDDGNAADDPIQIQVNPPGGLPFADAGPNQNVLDDGMGMASITLDGSDSFDSNGSITSWVWSEMSFPHGSGETLVLSLGIGVHVIELEVTDDDTNVATNTVTISITPVGGLPPFADAGADIVVTDTNLDDSESVTLDGSGSTDPDGTITSWSWSEGGVPIGSGEMLAASFSVGVHTVDLVVEDDLGATGVDSVEIVVEEGIVIDPPIVVGTQATANAMNETSHLVDVDMLTITEGDLLVAHICADGGSGLVITCPIGWSEVVQSASISSAVFGAVCIKQADTSDESALAYEVNTSGAQQTQSGVIVLQSHDPLAPIDVTAIRADQLDTSPQSPAPPMAPQPFSQVLRFMCANGGQVTNGVGYPAGMVSELWLLESADGSSGPVSGGAAIDTLGNAGSAVWTDALATSEQSVNFTIAIAGVEGEPPTIEPMMVPGLSGPGVVALMMGAWIVSGRLIARRRTGDSTGARSQRALSLAERAFAQERGGRDDPAHAGACLFFDPGSPLRRDRRR